MRSASKRWYWWESSWRRMLRRGFEIEEIERAPVRSGAADPRRGDIFGAAEVVSVCLGEGLPLFLVGARGHLWIGVSSALWRISLAGEEPRLWSPTGPTRLVGAGERLFGTYGHHGDPQRIVELLDDGTLRELAVTCEDVVRLHLEHDVLVWETGPTQVDFENHQDSEIPSREHRLDLTTGAIVEGQPEPRRLLPSMRGWPVPIDYVCWDSGVAWWVADHPGPGPRASLMRSDPDASEPRQLAWLPDAGHPCGIDVAGGSVFVAWCRDRYELLAVPRDGGELASLATVRREQDGSMHLGPMVPWSDGIYWLAGPRVLKTPLPR